MPFQPQHRQSYSESHARSSHDNFYGAANAVYQSGQTLSAAGFSPTSVWSPPKDAPPTTQPAQGYNFPTVPYSNGGISRRASLRYAPPALQQAAGLAADDNSLLNSPRRMPTDPAMSNAHHHGAPPAYANDNNFALQMQTSSPQHPSSSIPGSLQPGQSRPAPIGGSNSASNVPTLPQISTHMQQQASLASRPMLNNAHSYSKSSPGTVDPGTPKYKAFSNTPDAAKYMSPSSAYPVSSAHGPQSHSPLGLADIRPRADTGLSDTSVGMGSYPLENSHQYATNSNYVAPWPIFATDWCKWPPESTGVGAGKIALGSYLEDDRNYIQILDAQRTQVDPENPQGERGLEFIKTAEASHAYPVTRILWEPPSSNKQITDLLATSGDHLRLWSLPNEPAAFQSNSITRTATSSGQPLQKLSPLALLSNSKSPEHTAPITSLDWNIMQPSLIITSSIDTTCTIWDIPTLTAKTQLIAHDKEVFDVRFCANSVDVFVSCGADGSVRMFDLRSLEHSTIIYEPSDKQDKNALSPDALSASPSRGQTTTMAFSPPLLRIAASPHDMNLLATFSQDSSVIRILDVRQPGQALLELKGHGAPVNCIEWSNKQRGLLASGGDDCCVLLWDLVGSSATNPGGISVSGLGVQQGQGSGQERGPSAVWECGGEVSNLSWAPTSGTLGVCGGKRFWGVQL